MKVYAKRLIALLLCLSIVGGVLPAVSLATDAAAAVVADNTLVVQNPGFEEVADSGVPGWYEYYASGENNDFEGTVFPGCTFQRSTERYHSGSASLKITDDSVSKTMSIFSSGTLNVHEGYTYRVSAWMYSESGNLPRLSVKFYDMYTMEVDGSARYQTVAVAGEWTQVVVEAVAPAGAVMMRALPTTTKADTAVFYVDDVAIEQLPLLSGWVEADGIKTASANAFADTEYVVSGFAATDAVTVSFLNADAVISQIVKTAQDTSATIRAFAPANTTAVRVQTNGSTENVVLTPSAMGTQVPDGSFESMGANGSSAWSGTYSTGETVAVPGGDFEIDLENNEVTTVTDWWPSHAGTTAEISGALPGSRGGKAVMLTVANPTKAGGGMRSPEIEVEPGKQYTVDLDYYVPSGAKAGLYIEFWSSAPTRVLGNADGRIAFDLINCTGGAWKDLTKTVTAPDNAKFITVSLYFNADGSATGARVGYIDNVTVAIPMPLDVDGTFEQAVNDPDPWTVSHNYGGINYTDQLAYTGDMSMKFTARVDGNGSGARSPLREAAAGKTYTFRAYYQANYATQWYLEFWDAAGTRLQTKIVDAAVASEWKEITASCAAPANTVAVSVLAYFPKATSDILRIMFVDDVSLQAEGEDNLLKNPGFEDHNTWRVNNFDNLLYFTDEKAASGEMSMKYEALSVGGGARSPFIPIVPGVEYTVDTMYLSPDGNSNLYIEYWTENDFDRSASKRCDMANIALPAANEWKNITLSKVAPANAKYMTVLLNTSSAKKTSVLYIDDLSVVGPSGIYADAFDDGVTEDNDFKGWSSTKGYIIAKKTTEQKTGGNSSVYIYADQPKDGFRSPVVEVNPGEIYTALANYITANDNLNIYLEFWSDPATRVAEKHLTLPASETWAQAVSDSMVVPSGAKYATVLLYFINPDTAASAYSAYIDDVQLIKSSAKVSYDTMVSTQLVTDGAYGLTLAAGRSTESGYIPVMSGKEFAAVADVKGDATMTLTYYDVKGAALKSHSATASGEQQRLVIQAQAPNYTFGARITLKATGSSAAYFDDVQIYAVGDGISSASFEDVTDRSPGKFASHWQSFGDVAASVYGAVDLPAGALATAIKSFGEEGGIRSSMIRVVPGTRYAVRADVISGSAQSRIAFYDSSFNRLGVGSTAPANAAYAAVEFVVADGNSAIIDDVEFATAVIDVSDNAQLFIDDYIIAETDLERVFYQAEKTDPIEEFSPIRDGSTPWQGGGSYMYGSVLYDEKEDLYKMWYQTYCGADATGSDAVQVMANYATSKDGINWDIPNLGPHNKFYPTQDSNILGNYHIQTVFLEYDEEGNPHYTMVTHLHDNVYRTMTSTDGLHWTTENSFLSGTGVYDVVTAAYDEENDRYISVSKVYRLGSNHRDQWTLFETADGQWSGLYMSNTLADLIDAQRCYRPESYGQGLYERDGVYIGFNWNFYTPGPGQRGYWNVGPIEPQLTFSRDLTEEWQRPTRQAAIPLGEAGSVDDGMIFTSSYAIEVGDEVWLYCGSWDGDHGASKRDAYIYIAKWRLDGFASLSGTGSMTTKPMTFDGNTLTLNADALGGSVTVELLDENGRSIFGQSDPITGDSVEHVVSWKGSSDLSGITGPVTVKINATDADIYSFTFTQGDVAAVGNEGYTDLAQALEAAQQAGAEVDLLANVTADAVMIPADVTLDLNGRTLTADSVISYGSVIDSGKGLLKTEDLLVEKDNLYLPLYDEEAAGYRFYDYSLKSLGVRTAGGDKAIFGFGVGFADADAYKLLPGAQLQVKLSWDGMTGEPLVFSFSEELLAEYADLVERYPALTAALMLTASGVDDLAAGTTVSVAPVLKTEAGTQLDGAVLSYTASAQ